MPYSSELRALGANSPQHAPIPDTIPNRMSASRPSMRVAQPGRDDVAAAFRDTYGWTGSKSGLVPAFLPAAMACALALMLVLTSAQSEAADTYYRWKDERGKLVVSDRPPPDPSIEYEVVSQRSTLIRRVQPGEGAVPPEVTPRPGNEFEQVDTQLEQMEVVKKNPESCARAKANLETLNTTARIRIRDKETGELRFISEDEKDVQRQKARDTIRVHCD